MAPTARIYMASIRSERVRAMGRRVYAARRRRQARLEAVQSCIEPSTPTVPIPPERNTDDDTNRRTFVSNEYGGEFIAPTQDRALHREASEAVEGDNATSEAVNVDLQEESPRPIKRVKFGKKTDIDNGSTEPKSSTSFAEINAVYDYTPDKGEDICIKNKESQITHAARPPSA